MALNVHLQREGDEAWGFRLIGGTDFSMPLTVVKVSPNSPAERGGLRNGDTVSRINSVVADDLSHDDARHVVSIAGDKLTFGVTRGLYDPVLDDFDPIYEPIDQEDFDQPSQPTEVFSIQQFPDILSGVTLPVPEIDRSQTGSPFVLSTKPYRPFSTEPTPVPPLEDPIILNPDFKDDFNFAQADEELLPPTKFKLPISPQYDPDGTKTKQKQEEMGKQKQLRQVTVTEEHTSKTVTEIVKKEEVIHKQLKEKVTEDIRMSEERKFDELMRREIDLDKIEFEATNIVDQSIEKAVEVAEDIKHEIDVALIEETTSVNASSKTQLAICEDLEKISEKQQASNLIQQKSIEETKLTSVNNEEKSDTKQEVTELVELIDRTTEEIIKQNGHKRPVSVSKEVEKFEAIKDFVTEKKSVAIDELQEVIESGSVKRKSEIFDKEIIEMKDKRDEEQISVESKIDKKEQKKDTVSIQSVVENTETVNKKYSTAKLLAEQRAYTIGLQTIPNIRGTVHSSYHYDLLLKTFFIHLTDVMVALSRFILAEPLLKTEQEKHEIKKESVTVKDRVNEETKITTKVETNEENRQMEEIRRNSKIVETIADKVVAENKQDIVKVAANQEVVEAKKAIAIEEQKKTGIKMAQLTERKSEELTKKMEAVISEFQIKKGIEETENNVVIKDEALSHSVIEKEVAKEGDPLEWLSKKDIKTSKTEEVTSIINEEKAVETTTENKCETKQSKSKAGRNTYVAIVESHVYTNKDAILVEQLSPLSETSSVQSFEEIGTVLATKDAVVSDKTEETKIFKETAKTEEKKEIKAIDVKKQVELVDKKLKIEEITDIKDILAAESVNNELKESAVVTIGEVLEPIIEHNVKVKEAAQEFVKSESSEKSVKEELIIQEVIERKPLEEVKLPPTEKSVIINEVVQVEDTKTDIKEIQSIIKESVTAVTAVATAVAVATEVDKVKEQVKAEEIVADKKTLTDIKKIDVEKEELKLDLKKDIQQVDKIEKTDIKESAVLSKENKAEITIKGEAQQEFLKEKMLAIKEEIKEEVKTAALDESAHLQITKQEINKVKEAAKMELLNEMKNETIEETKLSKVATDIKKCEVIESKVDNLVDIKTFQMQETKTDASLIDVRKDIASFKEDIVDVKKSEAVIESLVNVQSIQNEKIKKESEFHEIKFGDRRSLQVERMQSIPDDEDVTVSKKEISVEIDKKEVQLTEEVTITESKKSSEMKLSLRTDLIPEKVEGQLSTSSSGDISTPTPSTYPPTPLTDEYIFRLQIPLPKNSDGTPYPKEPTPESEHDEDPHIVKKNLVPHIETSIEAKVYETPLPTPPEEKEFVYQKPGLKGGALLRSCRKEEIKEIERTSTLLASAIDKTIKSIEEYKEQAGMSTGDENGVNEPVMYNGYSKVVETKLFDEVDDWASIDKKIRNNNDNILELAKAIAQEARTVRKQRKNKAAAKDMPECLKVKDVDESLDAKKVDIPGFKPVEFKPEDIVHSEHFKPVVIQFENKPAPKPQIPVVIQETGEVLATVQGIVDGLEDAVVDSEVAKELGKPGMTEEKIAELISGESEMLREAHVMGVDFKKIKPIIESMKDSEVLKALNEELIKTKEEKKKEERKWTTFMQRPNRPVPRAKTGYGGYIIPKEEVENPYKVKIVKQPKPKVAPDYKPENFDTGPLPWESRTLTEGPPPPVAPEDPILIPEEGPVFLEAVDTLPESAVPDLEDTGIPLPPEEVKEEIEEIKQPIETVTAEETVNSLEEETVVEETKTIAEEMEDNKLAEQLISSVQSMVDPNASLEQQLAQMRLQLAALAQLPNVIQQTLQLVTERLTQISLKEPMENSKEFSTTEEKKPDETIQNEAENNAKVIEERKEEVNEETKVAAEENDSKVENNVEDKNESENVETVEERKASLSAEEIEIMKKEEEAMLEEQKKIEKERRELMEQARLEHESRQVKQHPTPRVGKPKPMFGPLTPQERPVVLPGGRKWRKPKDAYNEQFISEILSSQAEIIMGKAKGNAYESVLLPYDESDPADGSVVGKECSTIPLQAHVLLASILSINFKKYEKPPVSLDHLQNSDVYKLIHNMEQSPMKRVEMLTPVVAECDYREKCRSITPCTERMAQEVHLDYPQQLQP